MPLACLHFHQRNITGDSRMLSYSSEPLPESTNLLSRERTCWWLSSIVTFLGLFSFQKTIVPLLKVSQSNEMRVLLFSKLKLKKPHRWGTGLLRIFLYLSNGSDPFCSTHYFKGVTNVLLGKLHVFYLKGPPM